MTNAQKWISAFLGLFLILFIVSRVTKSDDIILEEYDYYNSESASETIDEGLTLINQFECIACHGADLKGTKLAPGLFSAKEYWSRSNLINYLRNPSSYEGDARFEGYKKAYKTIMPPYGNKDIKELGVIADYLLKLE